MVEHHQEGQCGQKAIWGEYGVCGRGVLEKQDTEDLTGHFKDFNFDCKEMGKSLRYSEQRSDLMKPTFFLAEVDLQCCVNFWCEAKLLRYILYVIYDIESQFLGRLIRSPGSPRKRRRRRVRERWRWRTRKEGVWSSQGREKDKLSFLHCFVLVIITVYLA